MKMLKYTQEPQAFLILTNKSSDSIIELYNRIQSSSSRLGDTVLVYHDTLANIPEKITNINFHAFTNTILHDLKYIPIRKTLVPGSNHFPLLEFYLQNPSYSYYWFIEDDVRFNGSWQHFFNSITSTDADFISCHLRKHNEEPLWAWWNTLTHPDYHIPPYLKIRSFNPIYRISNAALKYIHQLLSDNWQGHHEVLLPTLLYLEGFSIMDFGGTGKFVLPGLENQHYIGNNTDVHGSLKTGSMRYRPIITDMEVENKLYHPIKI